MDRNSLIEKELKRSSAENTQRIFMDITQVLLDSETFYELPITERSNMFNELRNVIDFKSQLHYDPGAEGHNPY